LATPTVCVPGSHTAQKHAKNELGWADFRLTDYASIERWWESGQGWKTILNHLRLMLLPYVFHWLLLFDIPGLRAGFFQLMGIMNSLHAALPI
jgi:hypothetical protein